MSGEPAHVALAHAPQDGRESGAHAQPMRLALVRLEDRVVLTIFCWRVVILIGDILAASLFRVARTFG